MDFHEGELKFERPVLQSSTAKVYWTFRRVNLSLKGLYYNQAQQKYIGLSEVMARRPDGTGVCGQLEIETSITVVGRVRVRGGSGHRIIPSQRGKVERKGLIQGGEYDDLLMTCMCYLGTNTRVMNCNVRAQSYTCSQWVSNPLCKQTKHLIGGLPPVLWTCPILTNSGCGKDRRILIGLW